MAEGLETVAALDDPVGTELARWTPPNGLDIARVRVPLGVVGIIYESRPNVTADAGALCLKAGNAAILRGGSESFHSSRAIVAALGAGPRRGRPAGGRDPARPHRRPRRRRPSPAHGRACRRDRAARRPLADRAGAWPRAAIPVLAHLEGNCHTYLHASRRPGHGGRDRGQRQAAPHRRLRRHRDAAGRPRRRRAPAAAGAGRADRAAAAPSAATPLVRRLEPRATPATEQDWRTEYLDAILAVKTVAGLDEAIAHVNRYGSHHTDCIVAADAAAAARFLREVDSAIVLHNASTQFADGGEFGMGAEIGIATGRLHARGPVGVEQLTSYKYVVRGTGQVRPA